MSNQDGKRRAKAGLDFLAVRSVHRAGCSTSEVLSALRKAVANNTQELELPWIEGDTTSVIVDGTQVLESLRDCWGISEEAIAALYVENELSKHRRTAREVLSHISSRHWATPESLLVRAWVIRNAAEALLKDLEEKAKHRLEAAKETAQQSPPAWWQIWSPRRPTPFRMVVFEGPQASATGSPRCRHLKTLKIRVMTNCCAIMDDGNLVLCVDNEISTWCPEQKTQLKTIFSQSHEELTYKGDFDGAARLRVGSYQWAITATGLLLIPARGQLLVVNVETGEVIQALKCPSDAYFVATDRAGFTLATSRRQLSPETPNIIHVWSRVGDQMKERRLALSEEHAGFRQSKITTLDISPDGRYLCAGGTDGAVRIWELDRLSLIATCAGHEDEVSICKFTPDGRVVSGGRDAEGMRVWDVNTGACLHTLRGHGADTLACTVSNDGNLLVCSAEDGTLQVWDLHTGAGLCEFVCREPQMALAIAPDNKLLVSCRPGTIGDSTVELWELHRENA